MPVTPLYVPFFLIALAGLALSLVAHGAALLGQPQPMGPAAWGLHVGILVVWIPAMIASRRLVPDPKHKDAWKQALRGCPRWVRWVTGGFFVYAIINFFLSLVLFPAKGGGVGAPPE